MNNIIKLITSSVALVLAVFSAGAQAMFFSSATVPDTSDKELVKAAPLPVAVPDSVRSLEELDAYLANPDSIPYDTLVVIKPLPDIFFGPVVYDTFEFADTASVFTPDYSGYPEMRWLEEENAQNRTMKRIRRSLFFEHPERVKYNITLLPEAPKKFHAVVNPEEHTIEIREVAVDVPAAPTISAAPVQKRHWIRSFNASLQFSQAYVSPNWYQGGNNNLNMLATIFYNVKLNPEYHPKLLFETTAQYKLGMNSAPDDSVHNYSISEDLFQVNSTFGVKAAKRWYYSLTAQFKTQMLNSYKSNSTDLVSSFLSPAELTVGVGMTYNYANEKKTVTFDASIAPLSYNLKTCINSKIDPATYNIDNGRKVKHHFGSSAELKFFWKISYNIAYTARIFAFTDYDTAAADWENKLTFDINRFLSTQLYVHMRYDSSTPPCDSEKWKKFQVKEILSIGFSYKFSSM